MKYKIKMLKTVCGTGQNFEKDEVLIVQPAFPETFRGFYSPTFNGATFEVEGYPYRKFFWHDEIELIKELIECPLTKSQNLV